MQIKRRYKNKFDKLTEQELDNIVDGNNSNSIEIETLKAKIKELEKTIQKIINGN